MAATADAKHTASGWTNKADGAAIDPKTCTVPADLQAQANFVPVAPVPAQPTFSGTPKEIVPGEGKQDTGIIVANKNSDTKVTAKDKNGKDIPAEFNDKTGSIFLTPDKDVVGPITVTTTDKLLPAPITKSCL